MRKSFTGSSSGFSLIEILIAVGILAVLSVGFAQLTTNQANQTKGLREQLASSEAQNALISNLSRTTLCSSSLAGQTFNSVANPIADVSLSRLNSTVASGSAPLFAVNGQVSPATAPEMLVQNITLKNIVRTGAAGSDNWSGTIELTFNPSGLVRSLRPIQSRINFATNPTSVATAKVISSCAAANDFPTATEFTLNLDADSGGTPPCTSGGPTHIGTAADGTVCAHVPGHYELHGVVNMDGYSVCFFSGSKTGANDSNMYDGCSVRQVSPGHWKLENLHEHHDGLLCRAICIP